MTRFLWPQIFMFGLYDVVPKQNEVLRKESGGCPNILAGNKLVTCC
jgi:hypothetical protein